MSLLLSLLVRAYVVQVNMLDHGLASVEVIDLLVFDEAHHCTKNHPYSQIMAHYQANAPR